MDYSVIKLKNSLALIALAALPVAGFAQTLSNGTGGGDWSTPGTWANNNPPTGNFTIQLGDEVTAGPSATLVTSSDPKVFGTLNIDGGDIEIRRLNSGQTSAGTLNVQSGRFSTGRMAQANTSTFTVNISGGLMEVRESIAITSGNTFNLSGGRFTVRGPLQGIINISGGSLEFLNGMSDFAATGNANSSWNGGRVSVNSNSSGGMSSGSWENVEAAWSSNAINELAIGSLGSPQTFNLNSGMSASQGILIFNIYSPEDSDQLKLLNTSNISLDSGVTIRIEGVDLEGSINDYIGSTYKIFDVNNGNYSNIAATVDLSDLTIGGQLYQDIEWDTSNLGVDGTISLIPEPSTYALMFGGLAIGLAVIRRRKTA